MSSFDDKNNGFNGPEGGFEGYNEPDDELEDDYDAEPPIGYGNPPKHSRFKKGQSGNPKGRPKASENPAESLAKELSTAVTIKENGQLKKVKAMDVIYKQLVAQAMKGNISILKKFMDSPLLDTYLFKDAMNKYNCPPENKPKVLDPDLKLIVNMAKGLIRKKLEDAERKKRGEIE